MFLIRNYLANHINLFINETFDRVSKISLLNLFLNLIYLKIIIGFNFDFNLIETIIELFMEFTNSNYCFFILIIEFKTVIKVSYFKIFQMTVIYYEQVFCLLFIK